MPTARMGLMITWLDCTSAAVRPAQGQAEGALELCMPPCAEDAFVLGDWATAGQLGSKPSLTGTQSQSDHSAAQAPACYMLAVMRTRKHDLGDQAMSDSLSTTTAWPLNIVKLRKAALLLNRTTCEPRPGTPAEPLTQEGGAALEQEG